MISGRTSTSQSSAFQYAPTTTINEKVYTERRLRMTSRRVTATLRQQLRQAARGDTQSTPNGSPPRRLWKCFPLTAQHVNVPTKRHPDDTGNERNTSAHPRWLRTPSEFHQTLCDRIERARRRVHLASLYIGPAVDPFKYDKEATFAQVLSRIDPRVDVRILLDQHRALRPVPVPPAPHRSSATISSAEACRRALAQRPKLPDESHNGTADTEHNKSQIHLLSVLGPWLSRLPNPYNEIAGVFHVKLYVVDDAVLLSGANLSQEYFADRHDRYVCIYNGGNGLVDTYVDLIQALSEFGSQRYEGIDENGVARLTNVPDRQRLFRAIRDVLTIEADTAGIDHEPDPDVIAYAVPTFQAPPGYFTATCDATELATMPTDRQTIHDLLRQTAAWAPAAASSSSSSLSAPQTTATTATTTHQSRPVTLRLASAYLNPTRSFLESTRNLNVFFLTAGKLSHGFRPKKVTGHVSKTAWIPTVFATLVASYPPWVKTWWYQRESWTFHAKGLWLTTTAEKVPESTTTTSKTNVPTLTKSQLRIPETDELLVVSHGSGNYGYRSEQRDMESNLLLVFPSPTDGQESNNPWAQQHIDEWNEFVPSAVPACLEDTDPLPKPVQWVLPYIKSFF